MIRHLAQLQIVFPMYEADDYRHRLPAIDDALVVHRRGDGSFQFELRPLCKLGPRSYGRWRIGLASELERGQVVMVIDRDPFLADIETLALKHAPERRRVAVERAVSVIAERTRHQILDHRGPNGDEPSIGRLMIARRPRRTKAGKYDRDGLNCINGIPTPRAEQMWNNVCSDWCDVRTAQHGRTVWERWVRENRPDMPVRDHE